LLPANGSSVSTPNRAARRKAPARATVPRAYVGPAEAAEYLDLSLKTIQRMINDGRLTAYRFNRVVKLKLSDLDSVYTVTTNA
jgi:excisionase family DNA binding protein